MNKDALMAALAVAPLFILFAAFFAAIYVRSRYNKAHPQSERTPAQRLRGEIISWIIIGGVVALGAYASLRETGFAPSWTITVYVGLGAYIVGEAVGRRNALRRTEEKSDGGESVVL